MSKLNDSLALFDSRQLLRVISSDWDASAGGLQRFERVGGNCAWRPVGPTMPVMLGRSGLAWGRGLHQALAGETRHKREGDGCAPAGAFAIVSIFGCLEETSRLAGAAKLPYIVTRRDLKAVDDPASAYYNRIVDQSVVVPDWHSCEAMQRDDERYVIGAVVAHNADPAMPGAGSCIFLHVWAAPGVPTAGCTALSLADMQVVADWLDGAALPVLVQLPRVEYERRCASWGLPTLQRSAA